MSTTLIIFLVLELFVLTKGSDLSSFNKNSKIVNGTDAKEGEIPFQVSLQSAFGHFCGGSILNENYVITAAHCVIGKIPEEIIVIAGTINLQEPHATHHVHLLIVHSDYNPYNSYINDIALIKVKEPFAFSKIIQPIALPEPQWEVQTNASAIVSGWGKLGGNIGRLPSVLQKAEIRIVDQKYCEKIMKERYRVIHPTHICANDPIDPRGQCNGDSGGPLVVKDKIVGIVSWSIKDPFCASTKYPGVFTRVSK